MSTFATPAELASFLQQDVDTSSATLVLDLVEAEMVKAAGVVAASLPAWTKLIGLGVAARIYTNPAGLTADGIDDYRRTFGGSFLTGAEIDRLSTVAGLGGGAFTITPYGETYVAAGPTSSTWDWYP